MRLQADASQAPALATRCGPSDYGSEGKGFESLRVRNFIKDVTCGSAGHTLSNVGPPWTCGAPTVGPRGTLLSIMRSVTEVALSAFQPEGVAGRVSVVAACRLST